MRIASLAQLVLLALPLRSAGAQGTVPTFQYSAGQGAYTLLGSDPAGGASTTIPTVLVPITLSFDAKKIAGKPFVDGRRAQTYRVSCRSPVFSKFAFPAGGTTQYADAMLRATFPKAGRVAYTTRQAGSEGAQDRGPAGLRLHSHVEEDRRVVRRRRISSSCKRSSSSSFPNRRASWSSP